MNICVFLYACVFVCVSCLCACVFVCKCVLTTCSRHGNLTLMLMLHVLDVTVK